ncbi:MAG TPA: hypothetical protein VF326_15050 [Anaerolineaceae bacterium]
MNRNPCHDYRYLLNPGILCLCGTQPEPDQTLSDVRDRLGGQFIAESMSVSFIGLGDGQTIFSVGYSMILTAVILAATSLMFKIDLVKANLRGGALLLLEGSLSFIGIGVMASVMPLLFPERGEQMTHVFIPLELSVSGVYYPINVLSMVLQKIAI